MSKVKQIYEEALDRRVSPYLCERGYVYSRKECGFGKWCGDKYEHVWFRCLYDKKCGAVDGGVWVGFKSLAKFLKNCSAVHLYGGVVDTSRPVCVSADLHALKDPRGPAQWELWPESDPIPLGDQILKHFIGYGTPFFERFATIPAAISYWKDQRFNKEMFDSSEFQLAAALWLQGDRGEAIAGLERLVEWRAFRLQREPSPGDRRDHRIATVVLHWFRSLERQD